MKYSLSCYNVTKTLHEMWNPIGCEVPEDEYECYAQVIVRMLQQKVSESLIKMYLQEASKKSINIKPNNTKILNTVNKFVEFGWITRTK